MNKTEAVTVLMPVYNGASFLRDQIVSILDQEAVDVSIVACDDASSDDSLRILMELSAVEPRLRVVANPRNTGLVETVSRLLSEVQSEYFAMSDQDDIWHRTKLRTSIDALESSGAELVYSDVDLVDASGQVLVSNYLRSRCIRAVTGSDPVSYVFRNPAIGHTMVARSAVALAMADNKPSGLRYYEPWALGAACSIGKVTYVDATLGSYRQHRSNVLGAKPARGGLLRRIQAGADHLQARQGNRLAALRHLAENYPAADKLQRIYAVPARPFARLARFPALLMGLAPYRRVIGWRAIAPELAAFLLEGLSCSKPPYLAVDKNPDS